MTRLLLVGGGTGGHLFPGLALAHALQSQDSGIEVRFIGTRTGLDQELVPASGYGLDLIAAGRGSPLSLRAPLNAPRFLLALWQSRQIIRRFQPEAVVALGGFAAAAPGLVARWQRLPLVVLEQNTIPGRTNRALSRWAQQVHLQFAEAQAHFPAGPARFLASGSPVRAEIAALATGKPAHGSALLILGGSQGAVRLNHAVLEAMPMLAKELNCEIIHVAGPADRDAVSARYRALQLPAQVHGFTHDMAALYPQARLAVSRAGAGSLAEFAVAGLPAVLLPLPEAKDDHQRCNARSVQTAGAAEVVEPVGLSAEELAHTIVSLWQDDARLSTMAASMRALARPAAGAAIATAILDLIRA